MSSNFRGPSNISGENFGRDSRAAPVNVPGETGLTLARTEVPDLILMDVQLPGMDGLTATALLKDDSITAAIPVIALSALAMKADQEKARTAGCDAYIVKPVRYQKI